MAVKPVPVEQIRCRTVLEDVPYTIRFNYMNITVRRCVQIVEERYWVIPAHFHDCYEFHYITSGEGVVEIEGNVCHVKEGDFFITAPSVKHKQISDETRVMQEYGLEIKIDLHAENINSRREKENFEFMKERLSKTCFSTFSHHKALKDHLAAISKEAAGKDPEDKIRMDNMMVAVVIEFLLAAYESMKDNGYDSQHYIQKIRNYIEDNLPRRITVEDVAKSCYLSARQVSRILVKGCGLSTYKFINKIRNETAVELLENGKLSMAEIAVQSGFGSYLKMFRSLKCDGYPNPNEIKKK